MKTALNDRVLLPGDIILTRQDTFSSRKIRRFTNSTVSHAMLYVSHSSIVHAVMEGVHPKNTQSIFFDLDHPPEVLRLKGGLNPNTARTICDRVRVLVGSEYAVPEAIRSKWQRGKSVSSKQFCSRLVAQAYAEHGILLVRNANYCTPGHLFDSPLLERVENALREVSENEYLFWQSEAEKPDKQQEATNFIMNSVRALEPAVQTHNDIGIFVRKNPSLDDTVNEIYQQSGYLDLWKDDYNDETMWRFDIEAMEKIPNRDSVERYCRGTLMGEPRDDNRFTKTLWGYRYDHARSPRKTFESMITLYERLVIQHALRVDTARTWLERHGQDETVA
jgi:hypothetical protein